MRASVPSTAPFAIIDLFAGPGGLDVAAHLLGIRTTGIEWDADACATRLANGLDTKHGDVRHFSPDDFPDHNVLAGGPPCQTFTVAGKGAGRKALDRVLGFARRLAAGEDPEVIDSELAELDDERTGLVLEPLKWALRAIAVGRPYQAIVLEQVPAVLPVWRAYAEILRSKNYEVREPEVLHTEEYGVPQTRRRAILIARWSGEGALLQGVPELPTPTHHRYRKGVARGVGSVDRAPWIAMNDVVRVGQKFEVVSNYGTGGDPKARGRRRSDEPSATVTGKISRNRVVAHGEDLKRFSDVEAGQLQTFPPNYRWRGNGIAQQVGNAVPPRLALHVIAAALDIEESRVVPALKSLSDGIDHEVVP
ncbi:DNA cytosine methyltransferase [Streptacidiphilus anmyonensis]|uniref:DNA cytosine methyltransferase n=1 Tax=Streptacidiphilus anmyonensis TaxID=405782 RepID=UPI0005AB20D0|nr:DNA cytosine methyltransferase [Streptacidiphilus anmyonensis]